MHTHYINDSFLVRCVQGALSHNEQDVTIPVTFYAALVGGIMASDALITIRLDVTMSERAGGMLRGKSVLDLMIEETRDTTNKAVSMIVPLIQRAADSQTELFAVCNEADQMLTQTEGAANDRNFWRLRSSVRSVKDTISDHSRSGVRLSGIILKDLVGYDAWAPLGSEVNIPELRRLLMGKNPAEALHQVISLSDTITREAQSAPITWRDLTSNDIVGMTDDHTIRHLLTKAAELRDEAMAVAGTDPERAGKILSEVSRVEREAMEAAISGINAGKLDRIESLTAVLSDRAKGEIRK